MKGLPLFAALSAAFPVVFLDQYGVLHNGRKPYPGAVEALALLRSRGTRTVIISNSGKPGEANAKRMAGLGFARALYDHFLTSGDVARMMLERGDVLVAFTDGITEAMSATGDEWGEDRLVGDLDTLESSSASAIAERVLSSARAFSRGVPQHDDMTVSVVRVL